MISPSVPKIDFRGVYDSFRNLNPNDVGAWPLAPRIAALLALFVAVLVAGWWFSWSDELDSLDSKQQEEQRLKDEYLAKKRQASNLDLYTQQLSEIDRSFGALLKQLPNKSEVESLLVEINQSGMGRGLQFELFKPGDEVIKDFYAELAISVRLTGSYHDFGAFAGDVGRLSRIVTLGNISIKSVGDSKEGKDKESRDKEGLLAMDAVTKTFRYLDDNELAAKKKADQEAKAKAGKGGKK